MQLLDYYKILFKEGNMVVLLHFFYKLSNTLIMFDSDVFFSLSHTY